MTHSSRISVLGAALVVAIAPTGCKSQSSPPRSEADVSRKQPDDHNESEASSEKTTPKLTLDQDESEFLAEVAKAIPVGTSIDEAERILAANGFKCERRNGSDGKPGLFARRSKQSSFITSWVWVLWLTEEDGKVSGITGSTAGLGL